MKNMMNGGQVISLIDKYQDMEVPSLFITGWYDSLQNENFKIFNG